MIGTVYVHKRKEVKREQEASSTIEEKNFIKTCVSPTDRYINRVVIKYLTILCYYLTKQYCDSLVHIIVSISTVFLVHCTGIMDVVVC